MALKSVAATSRGSALTAATLLPWSFTALVMWQMGAHVDVWYHLHYGFEIESFFTWPHGLLYAGWAATGLIAAMAAGVGLARGVPWRAALPPGYALILAGSALFGLGGVMDLAWHSAFGFEVRQEALLSPSHVWLAVAFLVCAIGVLQAAVTVRGEQRDLRTRSVLTDLPVILTIGVLLRFVFWFGAYILPFTIDYGTGGVVGQQLYGYAGLAWTNEVAQAAGSIGILFHAAFLALFLVAALRWLHLPTGSIAVIMVYEAMLITLATDLWRYLPAVLGAAVFAEAIWLMVQRGKVGGVGGQASYWLIGAGTPFVMFALYFAIMGATAGIIWSPSVWTGLPVVAAIIGLFASVLAVPPAFIQQAHPTTGASDRS
jgi:hypothetical protein